MLFTVAQPGKRGTSPHRQPGGAPFVAYHNLDMQDLDLAIGFPVERALPVRAEIEASAMPAGEYASVLHKGSYTQLHDAYAALTRFIANQGRTPSGVAYEFYLTSPVEVAEAALKTQIVFPLV
ncbi:MAG: GyrI-like domain-containing protein [Anaerolineales bacterium]|nr:GyrI-like domain-containing protein [Anaerolineales bacterium]